mmetsp:Transcript_45288/g.112562  ORF Transcript_45288/g.112562 Transcript_45288/m.112562 type:complete len:182 (-) Transcript_45288:590-1135(-)
MRKLTRRLYANSAPPLARMEMAHSHLMLYPCGSGNQRQGAGAGRQSPHTVLDRRGRRGRHSGEGEEDVEALQGVASCGESNICTKELVLRSSGWGAIRWEDRLVDVGAGSAPVNSRSIVSDVSSASAKRLLADTRWTSSSTPLAERCVFLSTLPSRLSKLLIIELLLSACSRSSLTPWSTF